MIFTIFALFVFTSLNEHVLGLTFSAQGNTAIDNGNKDGATSEIDAYGLTSQTSSNHTRQVLTSFTEGDDIVEDDKRGKEKEKPGGLSDPLLEPDFFFFSGSLSNSEKKNLLIITSSSEYIFRRVPKGANLDYAIQLAILAISEGNLVYKRLLSFLMPDGNKNVRIDMFMILDCLYSNSKKTLKLIKLIRQRCFFHDENIDLGIFPQQLSQQLQEKCSEFNIIETKYARLMDFVYLMRMIVYKSRSHNSSLIKLSKIIWREIKNPSFKKIKFVRDISAIPLTSEADIKSKDSSKTNQISRLVGFIDNTLSRKIKILPYWIQKSINEYNMILREANYYAKDIWSPFTKSIDSSIKKVGKCVNPKMSSILKKDASFSTKGEEFFKNVKSISKQIRRDIK